MQTRGQIWRKNTSSYRWKRDAL